jgi:threonine-phosphate decarboxylase
MDRDAVDDIYSPGESPRTAGGESESNGDRVPHGGTEDPLVLDFSTNTNPETPDGIARIYDAALSSARSYPCDNYYEFRAAAAEYVGCEGSQVIPVAGSLAAIRLTVATSVNSGEEALVPYPSFGEYAREVRLQGGDPQFVAHDEILDTDPTGYALAIVCNPNNPTGDAYDASRLRAYADRCRDVGTPLLVDEAFLDFTEEPTLAGRDGVVVTRSLTKVFGLPGLRTGFAVATGRYRDRLDTARLTWDIGEAAACVGAHCLGQEAFVEETGERVASERERMRERLETRFGVHPSASPFLLLDVGSSEAVDEFREAVGEYDIVVRDARTFRGLDSHVRVAIRLPYENDLLLDALDV